jgi:aspartate/methionine/tyrosine aminotransferase
MKKSDLGDCTSKSLKIAPFHVMELLEQAHELEARGDNIVHMEIGEPDFPTPEPIRQAAIKAITDGKTSYTHSLGLRELRERIARYYYESQRVLISPDRVVVTNGTSGAFFLLASVLLDRTRDSDPSYPCYRNFAILSGSRVTSVPVTEETRFRVIPQQIEERPARKHLFMICSPSNPTGLIYDHDSLARLLEPVTEKGGIMAVDEIYSGLTYGRNFQTAAVLSDDVIVIDGFSKTYAMTGWRLGWMLVPERLIRPIQKVAQNVFISAPTVAQYAAIHAFDAVDEVEMMKKVYQQRRGFLFKRLHEIGFHLPAFPEGAFYIYAGIKKWGLDSMKFVKNALMDAKVAVTPGYDFGVNRAGEHVRFSYANSLDQLREGCDRLEHWLSDIGSHE